LGKLGLENWVHFGLDARAWCDVVQKFGRVFKQAAGMPESLAQEAIRSGQRWLCARDNPLGMSAGQSATITLPLTRIVGSNLPQAFYWMERITA
jgi:hypothetical protein